MQRPVQPGETFNYRFTPPDAGTFWYHSHANETVQLEQGLYGALIVRGPDEPALDARALLVLDDLRSIASGRSRRFGGSIDRHNGREGNVRADQRPQPSRSSRSRRDRSSAGAS